MFKGGFFFQDICLMIFLPRIHASTVAELPFADHLEINGPILPQ